MTDPEDHWPALLGERLELRDRLLASYDETHRGYHDRRHLTEVLERLDLLLSEPGAAGVDRDAVVLAAWFHDAVYDGDRDDEERSATLAEAELAGAGLPAPVVREVARLVRLTHDHRPADRDRAGRVLCDADLAILASDRERYDEYVGGVRSEYPDLDDETFRSGRAAVLRALVDKPTLFHTDHGRREWEQPARRNVERELALLLDHARPPTADRPGRQDAPARD